MPNFCGQYIVIMVDMICECLTCIRKSVQRNDRPTLVWACAYSVVQDNVILQQLCAKVMRR